MKDMPRVGRKKIEMATVLCTGCGKFKERRQFTDVIANSDIIRSWFGNEK